MPYCPKCDMEFIDGITICSDCGGPLVESEAKARAIKEQEEANRLLQMANRLEEESRDGDNLELLAKEAASETEEPYTPTGVYVKKADKYAEMKSSASAFLMVGAAILVFSLLCWLGIISLPMAGLSKLLFQSVLTVMGSVFLLVSIFTYKSAGALSSQIDEENKKTDEYIHWFTQNYTGDALDRQLAGETGELSPEELSLKRFELIQDILITHHDITDQAYVDSLSEDIYSRLYESSQKGL